MTVKEFLIQSDKISLRGIAKAMYPTNIDAASYLNKKLKDKRPWTLKDSELATEALAALGHELINLSNPSDK